MRRLRVIFLLLFIFSLNFVYGSASVNGLVSDENNTAMPYANAILVNASDSSIIKAVLTNEAGRYVFEEVMIGHYRILVAQLGYGKTYSESFEVTEESQTINVRQFTLTPIAVQLDEANVTALRPFIEHKVDRTIVNVENSIIDAGATALEILKRSPGINVDNDGNIILGGKQGVLVMIDDKPTYLSQRDLYEMLKNTSSDQLSQIEIITNPSARYDAAGTSGIVNIRLRKKQNTGFNGRVQVSYGQGVYPDFGTGFSINYGNEKINVFAGYDYMDGLYYETNDLTRKFFQNDYTSTFQQHTFDKGNYKNHTFRGGADFFLTKKHSLGIQARGNRYANIDNTTASTEIYNNSLLPDSGYVTKNHSDSKWSNVSGNINYRFQIDTAGRELNADVDYAHYDNHNNFIFITDHHYSGSDFTYSELATDEQPARIDIRSFKIDYTHPFTKKITLEAGAKTSYVTTDNDVKYFNYYGGIAFVDTGKTNHFKYTEQIHAFYANGTFEFGNIGIQSGLRLERTLADGRQYADNSNFKRDYMQLFPSVFMSYDFSKKHRINASYSKRIDRPAYQQLNPFKYFLDPYNYMEGNPLLEPQLTNSFEAGYTFNQLYSITFNYSHTTDAMTQITKQIDSTHTTYVTTENLETYDNLGVRINVPYQVKSWWYTSNNFNLFRNRYKGIASVGEVDKYLTSYTFNSTNSFTLPKGIRAELSFWYSSKMVWGTWLVDPHCNLSVGISKMFLQDRIQLRINLNDILHTEITKSVIKYQNIDANFKRVYDSQFVRFHLSYKFGKQVQRNRHHSTGSEDEQSRVRQGR